ncbi:MAG: hypothetical protein JNL72_02640 [Flavipsychrobacter sp.]|nr:hypothetical protein [Flavipsychrobacter sp.]
MRFRQFLRFFSFHEINPVIGVVLALLLFLGFSEAVFIKLPHPGIAYAGIAFVLLLQMQSPAANGYLLHSVGQRIFFRAKLAEHFIVLLPFGVELLVHGFYREALGLLLVLPAYSWWSFAVPRPRRFALRTPYMRHSFEFLSGFRTYWVIYPLHLLMLVAAVLSANIYVLLVAYFWLLLFLFTFYGRLEDATYIWLYRASAGRFLLRKAWPLLAQYLVSVSLFVVCGAVFFTPELPLLLLCVVAGLLGLLGSMFLKYQFYPSEFVVQVSQMILLGLVVLCLFSPPYLVLLVVLLTYSFFKAKSKLKAILQC